MRHEKSRVSAWEGLKVIDSHAAGLDIGSEEIWAAVAPAQNQEPVRKFGTFTPDLQVLADWLLACGPTCVTGRG
jgi:transposase